MGEWKLLISGGIIGLLLSSVLVLIVLYRLSPRLLSKREKSLRDQHSEPVSRFGGIALFWGFILAIMIVWLLPFERRGLDFNLLSEIQFSGLCIGAFAAWGLGFCDDIFQLRARWKLLGQIGIAFLAVFFGFEIKIVQLPMFTLNLGLLSWPITVLWIVGIMNSINLIDGLDGLASGLAIIALSCMAVICWWMNQHTLLLLILILIGVTMGFWSFNRPQAAIFMGDSGSLFLGYTVALLSIWVPMTTNKDAHTILPLLILAVPILDTIFSIFRRILKGIPFYSADNDHLHHRLISKGFSPYLAMVFLVFSSMLFGGLALMSFNFSNMQGFIFLIAVILAYLLLYWLEYDIIRRPFNSLWGQGEQRKNRNLMLALCEKIEDFFAKDEDQESLIRSYNFCTEMAGVSRIELRKKDMVVWKNGPENKVHRVLLFQHYEWEVRISLPESSWKVDSDVKGNLLEKVSLAFLARLRELGLPSVIDLNKNNFKVK